MVEQCYEKFQYLENNYSFWWKKIWLRNQQIKRQTLINEGHSINNINAATNSYGNIKIRTQKELNRIMVKAPNFDPETKRLYKLLNNLFSLN